MDNNLDLEEHVCLFHYQLCKTKKQVDYLEFVCKLSKFSK